MPLTGAPVQQPGEPEGRDPRPDYGPHVGYPRFYTPRLMLQEPRNEDLDFLAELFCDPKVMHHIHDGALGWDSARKYANAIIELTQFSLHHGWWIVSRRDDAKRLGLVRLGKYENVRLADALGDDLQIDYQFAAPEWGHGYAVEALNRVLAYAFGWLYGGDISRVLAWTHVDNLRSQKLLLRLGFQQIGNCHDEAKIPQPCFLYKVTGERWKDIQRSSSNR